MFKCYKVVVSVQYKYKHNDMLSVTDEQKL